MYLGNQRLGVTPYPWITEQAHQPVLVTFRARGFKPKEEQVSLDADHKVSVARAKAEHHGAGTGGKQQEPALEIKTGR